MPPPAKRKPLLLLLAGAFLLKVILVLRGGQIFWPDEERFFRSAYFVAAIVEQGVLSSLDILVRYPEHNGFTLVLAPAALVQCGLKALFGMSVRYTGWIAALWCSLFSTAAIGMVHAIAARAGANERESMLASTLVAASTPFFFMSRHILPYESSLLFFLVSLWFALGNRRGPRELILGGLCASLGFLTYNGFWFCVPSLLLVYALRGNRDLRGIVTCGALAGVSFIAPILFLQGYSIARGLPAFLGGLAKFSGTVTQGDYREGWSVPWAYLWHAEHGLLFVWAVGLIGIPAVVRYGRRAQGQRGMLWFGAVVVLYASIALLSTGLHRFVVYGRMTHPLIPLLCLATACTGELALGRMRKPALALRVVGMALALVTAVNFYPALAQRFPSEFEKEMTKHFGELRSLSTVIAKEDAPAGAAEPLPKGYVLLNARNSFYPPRLARPIPPGRVVAQAPHPLEYLPYLYEGYSPPQRNLLREADISMRVVQLP